jgi:CubicO group peptidase (beta-lactamase class C family)
MLSSKTMNSLPRATPESQGIPSPSILNFLKAVEQRGLEFHSFMLLRHGQVIAEGWWSPYHAQGVQLLYSVSKSFTSTAIGFAIDEGLLSEDEFVTSLFPDDVPKTTSEHLAAMKVRHLLSMATGHVVDTLEHIAQHDNWVKGFLSVAPKQAPGSIFCYNNGATFMLSAIIQKLTGMKLLEYLRPRLFEPLGITKMRWDENPQGLNLGFSGLHTTTEAIAKFGQLYLRKGVWQGKRLLSEWWIEIATREHIPNASTVEMKTTDWGQGYGYQFWRCQYDCYRADGAFGQYCVVMPKQDAVLAITSAVLNMQDVLDLTWEHLLPAMTNVALANDATGQAALSSHLTNLEFTRAKGEATSPITSDISGKRYKLGPNPENLYAATLHFHDQNVSLNFSDDKGEHQVLCGYKEWSSGMTTFYSPVNSLHVQPTKVEVSGAWTDANTLTVKIIYIETPHCLTMTFHFDGNKVTIKRRWNESFGPLELPPLVGHINS